MDVFSTAATALSLLATIFKYLNDIHDAREDRTKLLIFLRAIHASLLTVRESAEFLPYETRRSRVDPGTLKELNNFLTNLRNKIESRKQRNETGDKITGVLKDLKWPFEKKSVDRMVADLLKLHQAFLGIQAQILHGMTDEKLQKLEDILVTQYERKELKNHIKWLSDIEESEVRPERDRSVEVRPTWFWNDDHFRKWEAGTMNSGTGGLLWCPGKVGVGKTMFSAFLFEALLEKYRQENVAVLIFYFHYKQEHLHTTDKIIGYLCRQLLTKKEHLLPIIKSHKEKEEGREIGQKDLPGLLRKLLEKFDGSFIILDAFDECNPKNGGKIVQSFRELLKGSNLRVLITGRHGCERYFEKDSCMEILALDTDIKAYIQRRFPDHSEEGPEGGQAQLVERIVEQRGGDSCLPEVI
jgi:hypothetical protein